MNDVEVKDEIRIIREMLEKTKKATADSGAFFLTWGFDHPGSNRQLCPGFCRKIRLDLA